MRRNTVKRAVLGLALGAALAGSAACSGGSTPTPTATTPVIDDAGVSPKDLATPPVLNNIEGARKDVTIDQCSTQLGPQTVKGSVTSSATTPMDYVITVNWVRGSDVMGRGFVLLEKVQPGKATDFEVKTTLTKAADSCTVNVTRGHK